MTAVVMAQVAALAQPPREGRPQRGRGPGGEGFGPRGGGPEELMRALPIFAAIDRNSDGEISTEEIGKAAAALKTLDKNSDGKLTMDELRPEFGRMGGGPPGFGPPGGRGRGDGGRPPADRPDPGAMVERLLQFDRNGDGRLERDEIPERLESLFARGDVDNDGYLSKSELTAAADRGAERGPPRMGDRDGERSPEAMVNRMFEQSDADKDGKLSQDEVPDRIANRFADVDANGDGFIDRKELGSVLDRLRDRGIGGPPRGGGDRPASDSE